MLGRIDKVEVRAADKDQNLIETCQLQFRYRGIYNNHTIIVSFSVFNLNFRGIRSNSLFSLFLTKFLLAKRAPLDETRAVLRLFIWGYTVCLSQRKDARLDPLRTRDVRAIYAQLYMHSLTACLF